MREANRQDINGLDPPPSSSSPVVDSTLADPNMGPVIDMSQVARLVRADHSDSSSSPSLSSDGDDTFPGEPKSEGGKKRGRSIYPWRVYWYGALESWMSLAYGYAVGLISATLLYIPDLSQTQSILIVIATLLGAFAGALAAYWLADTVGRRPLFIANYGPILMSAVGCALASAPWQLMLWRGLLGLGVGLASVLPPMHIGELVPESLRARFQVLNQMAGSLGIALALFASAGLGSALESRVDAGWRWMFASSAVLGVVGLAATAVGLPETPRWLIAHRGDKTKARRILDAMYSPLHASECSREFRTACDYAANLRTHHLAEGTRWRELARQRNRRSLAVALVLSGLQQLGGACAFLYWPATIFAAVGVERGRAILLAATASIPQVFSFLCLLLCMERVGKRPLLLASLVGCAVSLAGLGVVLCAYLRPHGQFAVYGDAAPLLVFFGFLGARLFHAIGLGPIPQILIPEMVPLHLRGRIASLSSAVYWLLGVIVAGAFLPSLRSFAPYVLFWLFAAGMLVGLWFVGKFVHGVHSRAQEEIERVHQLPVVAPDNDNRPQLPADSLIAQLRPVVLPMDSYPIQSTS